MPKLFIILLSISTILFFSNVMATEQKTNVIKDINLGKAEELLIEKEVLTSALMCPKTGEQVSGMNKICYYNCMGSQAAITIPKLSFCPMSINR